MLAKVSRKNLIFIIVATIIASVMMIGIISNVQGNPERDADNGSLSSQNKAEPMQATDKTEIATEVMVAPPPVPQTVKNAEQQMPPASAPAYENACGQLKQMYGAERSRNVASENAAHAANQQAIINRYSQEGMSFSRMEKAEQAQELKRHNAMLQQIEKLYNMQIRRISC